MRSLSFSARKLGFLIVAVSLAGCSGAANLNPVPQIAGTSQSHARSIQSLPTSKGQCKDGGWQSFGVFKNQGDCVSYVATGGKNPPDNTPTFSPFVAICVTPGSSGGPATSPNPLTCTPGGAGGQAIITEAGYTGIFTINSSSGACTGLSIYQGTPTIWQAGVNYILDVPCVFTVADTNGQSMTITMQ